MVRVLFFFIIMHTADLFASREDGQLLKCLGAEERNYHQKKITGPLYDLNQRLIAEMVQIPKVDIDPESYQNICHNSKLPASWKLLELSISNGKNIFIIPSSITGSQKQMTLGMIDDYLESTRSILLTFISQIQTLSPTPNCLSIEIPELDSFFTDIKYLEEDVDLKKIFEGRDLKIFEKLYHYPEAFQRCKARIKKKPKSESTLSPKKT